MGLLILFLTAAGVIIALGTLALIRAMERPPRCTYAVALARRLPAEPREMGWTAEEHTFTFDDGATSPGWIIAGHENNGPTVIYTHGLGDGRIGALRRVAPFLEFASRVVVYDLRGHGASSAAKTTLTKLEPADLLALVNTIDDGTPIILAGHSMGGGIALRAAVLDQSSRSHGNPPPSSLDPDLRLRFSRPRIAGVIMESAYRFPMEPIAGTLRQRGWPTQPFVLLAGLHFCFWLGITNRSFDRARLAAELKGPLLIINGDADPLCPLASAQAVAAAAPQATFILIPGAGHSDLAEADPIRYREALSDFFAAIHTAHHIAPASTGVEEAKSGDQEIRKSGSRTRSALISRFPDFPIS